MATSHEIVDATASTSSRDGRLESTIQFEEITDSLGIKHEFRNGEESNLFTYLEAMGGGLGVVDYDRDGWPDLILPGGGLLPKSGTIVPLNNGLWRNQMGSAFRSATEQAGIAISQNYTQGVASGDVDNDGFPDLLVTGFGGLQFYHNQGDGTFVEIGQSAGILDPNWSTSAAFGDFDNDGNLDIYVANYVDWSWENHPECDSSARVRDICPPAKFSAQSDVVFRSLGDGRFENLQSEIGLIPGGKGLGVICTDLNQDGMIDIYVANDTTNNYLYLNDGSKRFREAGLDSGVALDDRGVSNGSMGISVLDYDGNLTPDLWVCNYENETFALYKNDGGGSFRFVSSLAGITSLGTLFVAFGTIAGDLDHDGDEDLVVTSGHVLRFPSDNTVPQYPLLLSNNGNGRFTRVTYPDDNYMSKKWRGRGLVAWDFDRDGDLDLGFSNVNQPVAVLANQSSTSSGKSLIIDLIGRSSNRDAIGAQLVLTTNRPGLPDKRYIRWIVGGGSYMSQNPYSIHFSFPATESLNAIDVRWPSGKVQRLDNLEPKLNHIVVEP